MADNSNDSLFTFDIQSIDNFKVLDLSWIIRIIKI
jgi:hypothetical protein